MSDHLRDLIVASADSPSKKLDTAAVLAKGRSRRVRRRLGSFFATASIATLVFAAASMWFTGNSVEVDSAGGEGGSSAGQVSIESDYDLSAADISDIRADSATVGFSLSWEGDQFPGVRDCTVTVYGPTGDVVGERTLNRVYTMRPEQATLTTEVSIQGLADSSEVACSKRLDDPEGRYQLTEVAASKPSAESQELLVTFDSQWTGTTEEPGIAVCSVKVLDTAGTVLLSEETTFSTEGKTADNVPLSFSLAEGVSEEPDSTDIQCRPFSRELP